MKAIALGLFASFFFAFTFILNRAMDLEGGSWIWSAALRYFFMIPLLLVIVGVRGKLTSLFLTMKKQPFQWFIWSFIGFVLFYAPLCFAASFGPGWLIASTWQVTIIAGILLTPLFYKRVNGERVRERMPLKGFSMSLIIFTGVMFMQVEHASALGIKEALGCIVPVMIAAFAYPLGNRKMMEVCKGRIGPFERVLGMTIMTLPVWLLLSAYEWSVSGAPSSSQVLQCFFVAISSGVIATVLFFAATDLAKGDVRKLAAIEATQSGEIIFAVGGEMLMLSAPLPSSVSCIGMVLVMLGMILHSFASHKRQKTKLKAS
ncbi:DMT family transporter [Ectobacillus funiculus]|uniref:DMT family transporter n=1 Tax=Ectobacillus funiculus TaxID=137993 RepID=UPI00101D269B|nr:multidrug resistance efflux transporter family protein [Ectobacillus funiculus]